jgi:glucose/arabinose dehydrogenase
MTAVTQRGIIATAIPADRDAGANSWPFDTMLVRAFWTLFASIVGPVWAAQFVAISLPAIALVLTTGSSFGAEQRMATPAGAKACAGDNGGITLPPGFCATVFADNIGHARHLVVAPNGVVYVNTWSGTYYGNDKPPYGGFLVALQDTNGDGRANVKIRFGTGAESGNAGGTGIALYNGALYAETNDRIVRYALSAGTIAPTTQPEIIISGMPLTGDHPMHPFQIDAKGALYVDLGSPTNSCQVQNRILNSPGVNPCTELETRAGIWRYDANRTGQHFSPAERFVTGLRNGEGIAFESAGRIFATQHGRDQLGQNWPSLYMPMEGAEEPAEEMVELEQGADYGWPYCYYSLVHQKLVLAPEYGGDGGKARRSEPLSQLSRPTGRPTILRFTRDGSSRLPTVEVCSSPSTAHGTARPSHRTATIWCSSPSRKASLLENT